MQASQLMVANCPTCGKVFQKNLRNQCTDCSTSIDQILTNVLVFLRRNYRSSIEQVSTATGIPQLQLHVWIKEGKIILSDYPNLSYPCASCSGPIREQKLCRSCSTQLTREIRKLNEQVSPIPTKQQVAFQQCTSRGFQIGDRWKHV